MGRRRDVLFASLLGCIHIVEPSGVLHSDFVALLRLVHSIALLDKFFAELRLCRHDGCAGVGQFNDQ